MKMKESAPEITLDLYEEYVVVICICGVCMMKMKESAPEFTLDLFQNCDFPEELAKLILMQR